MNEQHEAFMQLAIEQAELAQLAGEVPVGAVLVKDKQVIGRGYNQCITKNDPSLHAEMVAIREASQALANYRLIETTLYVTLEPCSMCAGLLLHSRIDTLVFATPDPKTGAVGSVLNLLQNENVNHQINVVSGVLQAQCSTMLSNFFKMRRREHKKLKSSLRNAN